MINSRSLDDVPLIRDNILELKERCESELEIDKLQITSTYRDFSSQATLYAQGRTTPGGKVTNAKAGYSYHNFRMACDVAPVVNGSIPWNDIDLWDKIGAIGKECGLDWGGDFHSFVDRPHFQIRQAPPLSYLREIHEE